MELKHLVQRLVYRIEPKAGGGFIARAMDPTVPALEAATREELQQKIQAKLVATLGEAFPSMKLPLENQQVNFAVHVEPKPGGGFTVHSDRQAASAVEPATQEKFDHFAEDLLGFVEKHFPQLSEVIAAQAGSRDIKIVTNDTDSVTLNASTALGGAQVLLPTQFRQSNEVEPQAGQLDAATAESARFNNAIIGNTPITPEKSSMRNFFRFLLAFLVIAALLYFIFHR